tara:strand:- start:349 stop:699 length:351 start_codon:yes stop_codon:yes gene_type:complete
MYYNTTSETGNDLKESHKKSISQSDKVLEFFKENKKATPSDVLIGLRNSQMLLTSVRRCISDLTKDNYLEKTDKKKKGMYGKKEYVWQIHSLFDFVSNKPKRKQSMVSCIGYRGED